MLKTALLGAAVMMSAPALAQTQREPGRAPQTTTTPPVETPTTPDATTGATATPAPANGAAPVTQAQTTQQPTTATDPATAPTTAAAPAAAKPATGATQIAQVVDTEFPSYDKDSNGALSKAEFTNWMVALKTASDPATKATDPATQTWVGNAFTQADKDKSAAVSKAEVTAFLSQGA